jgi:hypothetical protein
VEEFATGWALVRTIEGRAGVVPRSVFGTRPQADGGRSNGAISIDLGTGASSSISKAPAPASVPSQPSSSLPTPFPWRFPSPTTNGTAYQPLRFSSSRGDDINDNGRSATSRTSQRSRINSSRRRLRFFWDSSMARVRGRKVRTITTTTMTAMRNPERRRLRAELAKVRKKKRRKRKENGKRRMQESQAGWNGMRSKHKGLEARADSIPTQNKRGAVPSTDILGRQHSHNPTHRPRIPFQTCSTAYPMERNRCRSSSFCLYHLNSTIRSNPHPHLSPHHLCTVYHGLLTHLLRQPHHPSCAPSHLHHPPHARHRPRTRSPNSRPRCRHPRGHRPRLRLLLRRNHSFNIRSGEARLRLPTPPFYNSNSRDVIHKTIYHGGHLRRQIIIIKNK